MSIDERPLWAHQQEAITRALGHDNFAFLFEPGTGKTRTTIEVLRRKYAAHQRVLRTLILCPTVVCDNWRREWLQFSKLSEKNIAVLLGEGHKRAKQVNTGAEILITNYQTLLMPKMLDEINKFSPEVIVADESHRLKTPSAKTTKAAIALAERAQYKYILTGTPVLKSLMDFFSQFKFLDGGETFGRSFTLFKNLYFYNANAAAPAHVTWPDWRVRGSAVNEINAKVFKKAMFVEKANCLDLPPLVRKEVFVDMSPEQERHYRTMEANFITYLNDKACVASIALTKGLRLMQIVSGFLKLEDGAEVRFKKNPRLEALAEILSDIAPNHKVIVWACFKENYEMIKEACGKLGYVELHGGTKNREEVVDTFQNDPKCRVLIGNQSAGGIGINLTAASYAIYYSRSFSLEHDIQSEARNYRGGSERHEKITRIDLVSRETIDSEVLKALSQKQAISDAVLRGMTNNVRR